MTRRQWNISAARRMAGMDAPALTARLLLCKALGISREFLAAHDDAEISPADEKKLESMLRRRLAGEPVALILGSKEFYGRDFGVDASTLIPRPETECLVDAALAFFGAREHIHFIDLGTGSGCIAITLAAERLSWHGVAVDISPAALSMARRNAGSLGVEGKLAFVNADFSRPLPCAGQRFDLVVSNPPYVSMAEYAALDESVRGFEPYVALVPGPTGMELPAAVVAMAQDLLKPGGLLLMEHGWQQGCACRRLCRTEYWINVSTGRDLSGKERFLSAVRK